MCRRLKHINSKRAQYELELIELSKYDQPEDISVNSISDARSLGRPSERRVQLNKSGSIDKLDKSNKKTPGATSHPQQKAVS